MKFLVLPSLLLSCVFVERSFCLSPDAFQIECFTDGYKVALLKRSALEKGIREFRLNDNLCTSIDNTTHLIVSSTNNHCGTLKRKFANGYEYSNELLRIHNKIDEENGEKPICPYLNIKVSCWHTLLYTAHARRRRSIVDQISGKVQKVKRCKHLIGSGKYRGGIATSRHVSSRIGIIAKPDIITCPLLIGVGEALGDDRILTSKAVHHRGGIRVRLPKTNSVCKPLENHGSFHTSMKLYTDQGYNKELNNNNNNNGKQQKIDWFEDVYYEVAMSPVHENLHVIPTRCYATPEPDANSEIQYTYISQGCPVDPTVKFYPSESGSSRFSITAFRFRNSESLTFYSHCELLICDKNDLSSQCQNRCNTVGEGNKSRRRRSLREGGFLPTNDIIFRSFHGIKPKNINKQPQQLPVNTKISRTSLRSKSIRYLFIKPIENALVTARVEASKDLIRKHHGSLPVEVIAEINHDGNIFLKGLVTMSNVNYLIKECYFGPSRLRSRQILLVKNGCITAEGMDRVSITHGAIEVKEPQLFSNNQNIKSFLTCNIQVCDENESEKCATTCKSARKRRNVNKDEGDSVDVQCFANSMTVTVKKTSTADQRKFKLIDPQCITTQNNTHFILQTGLNDCGTTFSSQDGVRYYSNEVREKEDTTSVIIRRNLLQRSVRCAYNTRSVSAPVKVKLERQTLKGNAVGRYQVRIDMYQDSNYTKKSTTGLVEVDENSDMYFEVSISNEQFNKNLALHLDACLGYPIYRKDLRQLYTFIEAGCAVDKTVMFYESGASTKVRFSIKPFKFSENDSNIAINCYVTACDASDKTSKCSKGCQN